MNNSTNSLILDGDIAINDAKILLEVQREISKVIVGQDYMIRYLLMAMITGGHVLIEGVPGLAKTLAVKTLSSVINASFKRIQFTPDLLPSDLIGTLIYEEKTKEFLPKKGPIFTNILLADEINRAPQKVQSALLEAMAEKQVTIGEKTHPLEELFLVLATENPIEHEGTYELPEAQLDRFAFKLKINYPSRQEEKLIIERMTVEKLPQAEKTFSKDLMLDITSHVKRIYIDDRIKEYVLGLVMATRTKGELRSDEISNQSSLEKIRKYIAIGSSPRASIYLVSAAKANALIEGRTYVIPEDVKAILPEVLRHRLILSYEARAEGISSDDVIGILLNTLTVL